MLNSRFSSTCSNLPSRACILLVILALCGLIRSQQQCYYPDGSSADNDTPCPLASSDSRFTFCCASIEQCFSENQVCNINSTTHARGSCTDSSWLSPLCPHFCLKDLMSNGIDIIPCGSGLWCCDLGVETDCCNERTNLFSLEAATMTQSISTSSSPTASGSLFSESSIRTSSSATTLSSSTSTSAPSALPASAKAAIGIFVPVAVALFVLLFYLVTRNKRLVAQIQSQSADRSNHLQERMMSDDQQQMIVTHYELTNEPRRYKLGEPQRHEMGLS